MRPQYNGWLRGSHHDVAGCVDCHLPHDFPDKYIAKARNGWNHSRAFTLHCHASVMPLYRQLSNGDATAGFEKTWQMTYADTSKLLHDSGHAQSRPIRPQQ